MKLKKVVSKYRDKYVIEARFMHGDADAYSTEECVCENEQQFKDIAAKLEADTEPLSPASGGNDKEYRAWGLEVFGSEDFLPWDTTGYDCYASFQDYKLYYYDENGNKFEVEL